MIHALYMSITGEHSCTSLLQHKSRRQIIRCLLCDIEMEVWIHETPWLPDNIYEAHVLYTTWFER